MFQFILGGIVLGAAFSVGQDIAENHILPAVKKFCADCSEGWAEREADKKSTAE